MELLTVRRLRAFLDKLDAKYDDAPIAMGRHGTAYSVSASEITIEGSAEPTRSVTISEAM